MTRSAGDDEVVERALGLARVGEAIEIFIENSVSETVTVVDGEAESTEARHEHGAGLRLFREGTVGFASTSDLSSAGLAAAAEQARELSRLTRAEPAHRPARPAAAAEVASGGAPPGPFAPRLEAARRAEAAARRAGPEVKHTRASMVTEARAEVRIAHSAGLSHTWSCTRAWVSVEIVAERGDSRQTGFETDWALDLVGLDPERTGSAAAARALAKFGAGRPASRRVALVLDPTVTAGLIQALSPALSGMAVLRGRSLFEGRVGETVASGAVTLVDDGTHPAGYATSPVDGEGTPSTRTILVDGGKLQGFVHDTYTATRLDHAPTGHAVRDGYLSPPRVGSRNLHLLPSGRTRAALLSAAGEGIHVDEVMGLHTVDPVTGEFSLGASGRHLVGGEFGEPLAGFTVSGRILDLLSGVEGVGDDLRFLPGGAGGSTLLLREILVSGA